MYSKQGMREDLKRLYIQPVNYLTLVLEELGELDQAMKRFEEAIEFCRDDSKVSCELSKLLVYARDLAIKSNNSRFLKKAVEYDEILVGMAREEFGQNDTRYAKAIFEKVNTCILAYPENVSQMLDDLDQAFSIEETSHQGSCLELILRIMVLKAKIVETKLQNTKLALSIYSKCLSIVDQGQIAIEP
jgi:tetratricopeptide (TPR) repeat protein